MLTNFAALDAAKKTVWSKEVWEAARTQMFVNKFIGSGDNNLIQRITELTKTEKGDKCIIQLVADLVEDGVIGDNEREGNEEALQNYALEIVIDLITHSVRNKGKLSDQRTVINFRKYARNRLSYWLSNRIDQLAFLTMSGISYAYKNDGSPRLNSPFPNLAFASDVSAPTANRSLMWDGSQLLPSVTGNIANTFLPNYKMIVDSVAYAKEHYVTPLRAGGKQYYVMFVAPMALAEIKKDADFQRAVVTAMPRSAENPWFTGATVTIDGAVLHEHNYVFTTKKAANGAKWGAGGAVNGTRTLLCGAQALGMADIGDPEWNEKTFQYGSQQGVNVDKMLGLLKPKFHSIYDNAVEDFGIVAIDHYIR